MVVGGVLSIITAAYVAGTSYSYDLLLGRGWLRRMKAVINFQEGEMRVTVKAGHSEIIQLRPAPRHGERVIGLFEEAELPREIEDDDYSDSD